MRLGLMGQNHPRQCQEPSRQRDQGCDISPAKPAFPLIINRGDCALDKPVFGRARFENSFLHPSGASIRRANDIQQGDFYLVPRLSRLGFQTSSSFVVGPSSLTQPLLIQIYKIHKGLKNYLQAIGEMKRFLEAASETTRIRMLRKILACNGDIEK